MAENETLPSGRGRDGLMLGICLILFIVMLVFAFVPGWLELRRKKDDKNIYINNDYVKDPEYFAKSFKTKLLKQGQDLNSIKDGQLLELSKPEIICCPLESANVVGASYGNITIFKNRINILPDSKFSKEVVFLKPVVLSTGTMLRAGLCMDDCVLAPEVQVVRWLDARKITAGESCDLGVSTTARETLVLNAGCHFKRLYAPIIEIGKSFVPTNSTLPAVLPKPRYDTFFDNSKKLKENMIYQVNIVKRHGDLLIKRGVTITGSIKSYGKITIASGATIFGNVFGNDDIIIETGARVLGDVFADGIVELGSGSSIGQPGKCKSLVTRKGIKLHTNCSIYGYVSTDGEGIVL